MFFPVCWSFWAAILAVVGSAHQDASKKHSAMLDEQVRLLAAVVTQLVDLEYPRVGAFFNASSAPGLNQQLLQRTLHSSIGVAIDPSGKAGADTSMVYLWSQPASNRTRAFGGVFTNATAMLGGPPLELGDFVHLEADAEDQEWEYFSKRGKRAPKGGGGGGGRGGGGGGGRGGGGGGRGSSAARSGSARASSGGRGGGAFASGIGGARPHVWVYMRGGGGGAYYNYADDRDYEEEKDVDSDVVRMEVSLCFGRHKSRESCSAKVDALLEKMAYQKHLNNGAATDEWKALVFFVVLSAILVFGTFLAYALPQCARDFQTMNYRR